MKPDSDFRAARQAVRKDIVRIANQNLISQRTLTLKNVQEAVAIVRSRGLVTDEQLVAAGYRPAKHPGRGASPGPGASPSPGSQEEA